MKHAERSIYETQSLTSCIFSLHERLNEIVSHTLVILKLRQNGGQSVWEDCSEVQLSIPLSLSLSLLPSSVRSSPSAFGSCRERSEPSSGFLAQFSESLQLLSALCLGNQHHSLKEPGLPPAALLCGRLNLGPPWI